MNAIVLTEAAKSLRNCRNLDFVPFRDLAWNEIEVSAEFCSLSLPATWENAVLRAGFALGFIAKPRISST